MIYSTKNGGSCPCSWVHHITRETNWALLLDFDTFQAPFFWKLNVFAFTLFTLQINSDRETVSPLSKVYWKAPEDESFKQQRDEQRMRCKQSNAKSKASKKSNEKKGERKEKERRKKSIKGVLCRRKLRNSSLSAVSALALVQLMHGSGSTLGTMVASSSQGLASGHPNRQQNDHITHCPKSERENGSMMELQWPVTWYRQSCYHLVSSYFILSLNEQTSHIIHLTI